MKNSWVLKRLIYLFLIVTLCMPVLPSCNVATQEPPEPSESEKNEEASESSENNNNKVTPKLQINATTNEWEISYDGGATWTSLGVKADSTDELTIENAEINEEGYLAVTLSNGTKLPPVKIPDSEIAPLIKADRPESGKENFTFTVSDSAGKDIASIHLPQNYSTTGKPVKLVIMNRGAGVDYTATERYELNTLLLQAGYATLHVRGIPETYQNEKYIQGTYGAPYGSPAFIESVTSAYQYVTRKYNIDKNGCAVFGVSCGGLSSLNLINSKALPIQVAVIDAPVVDLHNDCYFGGDWISGSLGGKTAAGVAWMYQFDHCDFAAGTYTIDGATYSFSSMDKTSLEKLWSLNKDKVEPYNPYEVGKYQVDGGWAINFPCPVKMWFGLSETTNSIPVGQEFIARCSRGGTDAEFRGLDTSNHGVHLVSTECRLEMLSWIDKYLPTGIENIPIVDFNANSSKYLSGIDGSLIDTSGATKFVSNFIEIPENSTISEFCAVASQNGTNAYCAFYDENKEFISAYMPKDTDVTIVYDWKYTKTPPEIPAGAKYIRIAFNNGLDNYSNLDVVKMDFAVLKFKTKE